MFYQIDLGDPSRKVLRHTPWAGTLSSEEQERPQLEEREHR